MYAYEPLRAADSLRTAASRTTSLGSTSCQAAAFVAAERRPASAELVALDDRLGAAAQKEGFPNVLTWNRRFQSGRAILRSREKRASFAITPIERSHRLPASPARDVLAGRFVVSTYLSA